MCLRITLLFVSMDLVGGLMRVVCCWTMYGSSAGQCTPRTPPLPPSLTDDLFSSTTAYPCTNVLSRVVSQLVSVTHFAQGLSKYHMATKPGKRFNEHYFRWEIWGACSLSFQLHEELIGESIREANTYKVECGTWVHPWASRVWCQLRGLNSQLSSGSSEPKPWSGKLMIPSFI